MYLVKLVVLVMVSYFTSS